MFRPTNGADDLEAHDDGSHVVKSAQRSMLRIDPTYASPQSQLDGKMAAASLPGSRPLGAAPRFAAAHHHMSTLPPTPMTAYFDAHDMSLSYEAEEEKGLAGANEAEEVSPSATASSPPTSTGTSAQPVFTMSLQGQEQHDERSTGQQALHDEVHNAKLASEHAQDAHDNDGSVENQSFSSEADSPGPITPATPGTWKPRELTLLRPRHGSEAASSGAPPSEGARVPTRMRGMTSDDVRSDRGRATSALLEGLGIRGVSTASFTAGAMHSTPLASPRPLARGTDILPIASKSHQNYRSGGGDTTSSVHSSSVYSGTERDTGSGAAAAGASRGPRELKLASSTGPPSTARMHAPFGNATLAASKADALRQCFPPSLQSHSAAQKAYSAPSTSRLPVRHGPAFTPPLPSSPQQVSLPLPQGDVLATSPDEAEASKADTSKAPSLALRLTEAEESAAERNDTRAFRTSPHIRRPSKDSLGVSSSPTMSRASSDVNHGSQSAHVQGSFADSLASGSRRKGPPAPLLFIASPPSSYSNSSGGQSRPNSALSIGQRSPLTANLWHDSYGKAENAQASLLSPDLASPGLPPMTGASVFSTAQDVHSPLLQSPAASSRAHDAENDKGHSSHVEESSVLQIAASNKTDGEEAIRERDTIESSSSAAAEEESSEWRRQTPSAGSVVNAFEFDTLSEATRTDSDTQLTPQGGAEQVVVGVQDNDVTGFGRQDAEEETSTSRDSSSLGSVSHRPPSPAPRMSFNTKIFAPAAEDVASEVKQVTPTSATRKVPAGPNFANTDAMSSPLAQSNLVRGRKGSSTRAEPVTVQAIASNQAAAPVSKSRSSDQLHARSSTNVTPTSATYSHHLDTHDRRESRSRSKPSFVPDVPSFGYMGRMTSNSVSPSPQTPLLDGYEQAKYSPYAYTHASTQEEEHQGTSRWSSGSEDEDDRASVSSKSARKGSNSRSRKSSQSTMTSSAPSSRRNTGITASSTLAPLKKSSLFAGLGLRKKSFAALTLDTNSQASASPIASTSDSPIMSRSEGMKEFPFPMNIGHKGGKLSISSPGQFHSPAAALNSNSPGAAARGASRLQHQSSSPSLNERKNNLPALPQGHHRALSQHPAPPGAPAQLPRLLPRPSDASMSTSFSSLHGSDPSTGSPASSPVVERAPTMPWSGSAAAVSPSFLQGLGIDIGFSGGAVSDSAAGGKKTTQDAAGRERQSIIKSYRSTDSLSKLRVGTELQSSLRQYVGRGGNNEDEHRPLNDKRAERDSIRQRAFTVSDADASMPKPHQRESFARQSLHKSASRWSPPYTSILPSMPLSASPERAFEEQHARPHVADSPDETPRIAYAALSAADSDQHSHSPTATRRGDANEDDDALYAMGQAFAFGFSSPPHSSSSLQQQQQQQQQRYTYRAALRKVRYVAPHVRPRYPSLTDVGRAWQSEHPDQPFYAALGPALLEMAMQDHSAAGSKEKQRPTGEQSDSGNDEYGSSEGDAAPRRTSQNPAGTSGGGDGRNNGSNDSEYRRMVRRLYSREKSDDEGEQNDSDNESIVSEDSYGASEDERPAVDAGAIVGHAAAAAQTSAGPAAAGSDDAPIGILIRDPIGTLKRLQRSETMSARQKGKGRHRTKAERTSMQTRAQLPPPQPEQQAAAALPGAQLFDPQDLAKRLVEVQRSRSVGHTGGHAASGAPLQRASTSRRHIEPANYGNSGKTNEDVVVGDGRVALPTHSNKLLVANVNKPLPVPKLPVLDVLPSSDTGFETASSEMNGSMMTAYEMQSSSRRPSTEHSQSSVVSDFAHTVRMRKMSRSRMRPTAMMFSSSAPVPAMPAVAGAGEGTMQAPGMTERSRSHATALPEPHITSPQTPVPPSRSFPSVKPAEQQHRVYLLNRQRGTNVNMSSDACARELLTAVLHSAAMPADARVGGWALFDVCAALGVERPVREYERLSDVLAARVISAATTPTTTQQAGYWLVKRTDLAPYLSLHALPASSPALAGWVYIQDGSAAARKWSKRWIELRDSALYQAKSERGREESMLCHMSAFDVYLAAVGEEEASWASKAPKKNAFAVCRATSVAEHSNPTHATAIHFCLTDSRAARHWVTAISRARSYVLRLEVPDLISASAVRDSEYGSTTGPGSDAFASVGIDAPQRSAAPRSAAAMPQRPLVQLSSDAFEAGSLLDASRQHDPPLSSTSAPPPPRGSSAVHRKPAPVVSTVLPADDVLQRRHDEVRQAERQVRSEGRPLIGLVGDYSKHTTTADVRQH